MVKPARVALLCSLVIVAQYATAADSPWAGAVEIKARWAPAIVVALREFQAHQGTKTDKGEPVYGDLRHYTIEMIPHGEILSVTFAPEFSRRDVRNHTLGGRTDYGIAVNYDVSLKTLKIVKTSWFR
jgi:hypothetical protein